MSKQLNIWLDDLRAPKESGWFWYTGYDDLIRFLEICKLADRDINMLSLDNDLGTEKEGYHVCLWLAENNYWPEEIRVHSANPVALRNMAHVINRYGGPYKRDPAGWVWTREREVVI